MTPTFSKQGAKCPNILKYKVSHFFFSVILFIFYTSVMCCFLIKVFQLRETYFRLWYLK